MRPVGDVWFVDVADYSGGTALQEQAELFLVRLASALGEIGRSGLQPGSRRPRPLVALPTVGVGGGGFDDVRGNVVNGLLQVCRDAVDAGLIDVVIVARAASDYAAFQHSRRSTSTHEAHIGAAALEQASRLASEVQDGSVALFLGAGVSMSAGLPSWETLIEELAGEDAARVSTLPSALDQAELLKHRLSSELGRSVAAIVSRQRRYGLNHALLAALGCREAVTTNDDELYELAIRDAGQEVVPVLPFEDAIADAPWLLKMHGDARRPDSIVLARSDFVGYHARSGPLGAVVQSLLLTKHLLVVGASMTDDNFLRLAHEVLAFRQGTRGDRDEAGRSLGTVLTLEPQPLREELWRGQFDYVPTSQGPGEGGALARRLAIFLDAVAMYAARAHHLADTRYGYLLGADDAAIAGAARDLARLIGSTGASGAWAPLRRALVQLGAASS